MEIDIVDATVVTGQLVQNPPRCRVPNVHEPVGRPGTHFAAVRGPGAPQQVLLEIMLMPLKKSTNKQLYDQFLISKTHTCENFDATFLRSVRPDVPYPQRVVHGIGEQVRAVVAQSKSGDGVRMTSHRIQYLVLPYIPDFDIVIDSATEDVLRCITEGDSSDLVSRVHGRHVVAFPGVPDLDGRIIAARN